MQHLRSHGDLEGIYLGGSNPPRRLYLFFGAAGAELNPLACPPMCRISLFGRARLAY